MLGRDHNVAVIKVLQIFRKSNKDKYHFRCTIFPFFWEVISEDGVNQDPRNLKGLMDMPPLKYKKEL